MTYLLLLFPLFLAIVGFSILNEGDCPFGERVSGFMGFMVMAIVATFAVAGIDQYSHLSSTEVVEDGVIVRRAENAVRVYVDDGEKFNLVKTIYNLDSSNKIQTGNWKIYKQEFVSYLFFGQRISNVEYKIYGEKGDQL